eukprot:8915728-Pyramimonas_sp.AAC.1
MPEPRSSASGNGGGSLAGHARAPANTTQRIIRATALLARSSQSGQPLLLAMRFQPRASRASPNDKRAACAQWFRRTIDRREEL